MRVVLPGFSCLLERWNTYPSLCWKKEQYNRQGHTNYIFIHLRRSLFSISSIACLCMCMCVVCLANLFPGEWKYYNLGGAAVITSSLTLFVSLIYSILKSTVTPPVQYVKCVYRSWRVHLHLWKKSSLKAVVAPGETSGSLIIWQLAPVMSLGG